MDPQATLADLRGHLAAFRKEYGRGNYGDAAEAGVELADSVAALLEWLAKGGYAPDWKW